jgi:hypothetical protein
VLVTVEVEVDSKERVVEKEDDELVLLSSLESDNVVRKEGGALFVVVAARLGVEFETRVPGEFREEVKFASRSAAAAAVGCRFAELRNAKSLTK